MIQCIFGIVPIYPRTYRHFYGYTVYLVYSPIKLIQTNLNILLFTVKIIEIVSYMNTYSYFYTYFIKMLKP